MIIAIEGIDGAGKNTLTTAVVEVLRKSGQEVQTLAFPQYESSIPAQLASRALYGQMGDLTDSAYAMATLFALDRHAALEKLQRAATSSEVLLLDRYVASNAAYSVARTQEPDMADWIAELEFSLLGLPRPDLQVLLDTPVEVAADRAQRREALDSSRTRDVYESDADLQARTAEAYRRLAQSHWQGRWFSVVPGQQPDAVAADILRVLS
ncbi:dTMP kinase [Corynebacterium epidermidicanis]|uniref:Thymidylate kinase n=1 Tax=Corynebacterium epidermidicanis TaxID=1050174 RepID=A0A0G3GMS7_9CORY|nr:dTMP kinase [Corynebacterium epidermidicanis]AKK02531.1 dTMP kinase [Corynebacterium epidermidicanis]